MNRGCGVSHGTNPSKLAALVPPHALQGSFVVPDNGRTARLGKISGQFFVHGSIAKNDRLEQNRPAIYMDSKGKITGADGYARL